ncbi:MAG: DUF523 and DUF1722 domain-containing protein [Planctomycetes bacterium]|nr:DUF523 and DUF1722 domain-containing protein [Planctomycetota bacterium]
MDAPLPPRDAGRASSAAADALEVKLGISACLLGEKVRFDGGHKRDRFLTDTLARFVTFVPVCPEVEAGLPIPRDSLRLVRESAAPRRPGVEDDDADVRVRLIMPATGEDHTERLANWARKRCDELAALGLSGYVLKKDSPSCGMDRVKVYDANGSHAREGRGLFAAALLPAQPLLPVEEEGRLSDPLLRENFFDRVFGFTRLRAFFASDWRVGDLVRFHSREKLFLLAHHTEGYKALGRVVAEAKKKPRAELEREYGELYMRTLRHKASPGRHANVLEHMLGYFKEHLTPAEKQEMVELVADYRAGLVPLVVPTTLLAHFVRKHGSEYLAAQHYLHPHPKELLIRNHV